MHKKIGIINRGYLLIPINSVPMYTENSGLSYKSIYNLSTITHDQKSELTNACVYYILIKYIFFL